MIFDGHIHIFEKSLNRQKFQENLKKAGIEGGIMISCPPSGYGMKSFSSFEERINNLMQWVDGNKNLYPFYWIDPLEGDACKQVELAKRYGVRGIKIICDRFFPGDEKSMEVYNEAARKNMPILFHSGIIWNGRNSSKYNRPTEFEALLEVKNLRFSLAHISWPWCDECLAVYGKFLNSYSLRKDVSAEMFIDITPGTPPIYRQDALTKLMTIGYDVENNIIFGTDCNANDYDVKWAADWVKRDSKIYNNLNISPEITKKIFKDNLLRFIS